MASGTASDIKTAEPENDSEKKKGKSIPQQLIELALRHYYFGMDTSGKPFGVPKGRHVARPLLGGRRSVRQELAGLLYRTKGITASRKALTETMDVLGFEAEAQSEPVELFLRAARTSGDEIYVDMENQDEWVLRITADAWEVLDGDAEIPVLFRRTNLTHALPLPEPGGDLDQLWSFVNVRGDGDRQLIKGWLVATYALVGMPCPLLNTIEGREVVSDRSALEVLIRGVFEPSRFLDLVKNFVVFSDETITDKSSGQPTRALVKRVAKYHQYWAVNAVVVSTVQASGPDGDRRGGVVWHTQGSGKSFEMVFYAAKIMRDLRMANPTLVFITDRNDLDDQLFGETFAPARILPETPVQASTRTDLRAKLRRASGGIVFTTLQKFATGEDGDSNPVLTERRNVVVIADEAHRSQYGFSETLDRHGRLKSGLAKHMRDALPGATYLGFTGTPIESSDKSTRSVFGDYVDVYDLIRAVEDGATVRIFYESRLAKIDLSEADLATLDDLADEITETVEEDAATAAKSRWSRLEAVVGADSRLDLVAQDIVKHWGKRRESLFGKGMIVAMSRRIAVRLYEKIIELRPDWHSDDPAKAKAKGKIKVVMTGSAADPAEYQPHIHSKEVHKNLKLRAKNADDELELVIVRDMWLTGFDAHHVRRQDDARRGADAGDCAREQDVPG